MDNSARITGYALVLAFLAGLLFVILALRDGVLFLHNQVRVRFPTIATLMVDDAIKLRGVEVGKVAKIEAGEGFAIATLEFYSRNPLPKDTRFINYNYSMFGARIIVLVPGKSPEPMDQTVVQSGDFSSGVIEAIHKVEPLLKVVLEYQNLARRLEVGDDSTPSLQTLLSTQVYPVLEEFGILAEELEKLEVATSLELNRLNAAGGSMAAFSRELSSGTDTLVLRANRTLEEVAILSAQSTVLLQGLAKLMVSAQDTSTGPGRLLVKRDLYDRTLSLTHALQDLLRIAQKDGLQDVIHFWQNVHFRLRKSKGE